MQRTKKLCIIVGARPNFIKIAPLMEAFKKHRSLKPILIHTGQHYDYEMSTAFFKYLDIPKPQYNLEIGSGTHAWQTAQTMVKLEPLLIKERPALVVVVGDVNSTLAGALTAVKLHIPVAHIEAGLRSFNRRMPEEINRVLTDHLSDLLFCPTKTAVLNLKKEGITRGVHNVGDIMYDAFLKNRRIAQKKSEILKKLNLPPKSYILATIHRAENTDDKKTLTNIFKALIASGEKIVIPLHPRTRMRLKEYRLADTVKKSSLIITKPVNYLDMLALEMNAKKIITDSGGVQKEAYWFKVSCITVREETEWVETIRKGWNILINANQSVIIKEIKKKSHTGKQCRYFGNGTSTKKIVNALKK